MEWVLTLRASRSSFRNPHSSDCRRVEYPWHPLHDQEVIICGSRREAFSPSLPTDFRSCRKRMPSDPRMDVRSGAVFGLSIGICSSRVVGFVGPVAATAGGYDRRITRSRRDRCDHTDDNPRFKWDYFNHGRSGRSGRPYPSRRNRTCCGC